MILRITLIVILASVSACTFSELPTPSSVGIATKVENNLELSTQQAEEAAQSTVSPLPPMETMTIAQENSTNADQANATITGQVIAGFGAHRPIPNLLLRIGQKEDDNYTYTDKDGYFTLSNLPVGLVDIDNSHLSFQVTIAATSQFIDLGKLKYPLFGSVPLQLR